MKTLQEFKKEFINILKNQYDEIDKKESSFQKSLLFSCGDFLIEKGRIATIGEVREWKGRKYKKIAPNKWRPIYESATRGAKQSIKILAKKISKTNSIDELMEIVIQNVNRFTDENGKTLDIVEELKNAVNEKKTGLNAGKPTTQEQIEKWNKEHAPKPKKEKKSKVYTFESGNFSMELNNNLGKWNLTTRQNGKNDEFLSFKTKKEALDFFETYKKKYETKNEQKPKENEEIKNDNQNLNNMSKDDVEKYMQNVFNQTDVLYDKKSDELFELENKLYHDEITNEEYGNYKKEIEEKYDKKRNQIIADIKTLFENNRNVVKQLLKDKNRIKILKEFIKDNIYTRGTFFSSTDETSAKEIKKDFLREIKNKNKDELKKMLDNISKKDFIQEYLEDFPTSLLLVDTIAKNMNFVTYNNKLNFINSCKKHIEIPLITQNIKKDILKKTIEKIEMYEKVDEKDSEAKESDKQITGEKFAELIEGYSKKTITRLEVKKLTKKLSESEIINKISGGDETGGSCASLALCYVANKAGYDVTDFRGGKSQEFFSSNYRRIPDLKNVKTIIVQKNNSLSAAKEVLKKMKNNKEYIFNAGSHAAIIKRNGIKIEYLELQDNNESENKFHTLTEKTLIYRFNCSKSARYSESRLVDVESLIGNEEFAKILPYFNTKENEQKKGSNGGIK